VQTFLGVGKKDDRSFILTSNKELTDTQRAALDAIGMDDKSANEDGSYWLGPRTREATYRIQAIAMDIEGKQMGRTR
jgi:hypothetical protein